jgi:pantoate--beta-alanine ligase
VVAKLFNICLPDRAYFGQKDAQQLIIIRKMTADLNISVTVVPCPIVREPDGLALSSRNVYLSPEERRQALVLNRSLKSAVEMVRRGERDASVLARAIRDEIETASLARIDYVAIVDGVNLLPADRIAGECLIALAVKFGTTRLIDNAVVAG